MAIQAEIYPVMPTRPCRYCLSLQGGAVFADFDVEDDRAYLVRVSFDGYGCCEIDDTLRPMSAEHSRKFIEMIESNNITQVEMSTILINYFEKNADVIWKDALTEHSLLSENAA